jgi:anti-anti-sigma factor
MEITRDRTGDLVQLTLVGRLDGYWCDHLTSAVSDVVHEGSYHIRLDCAQVSFLSSAGVGALVKSYRELARVNGTFQIVNPSDRVTTILRLTRLEEMLIMAGAEPGAPAGGERQCRRIETGGIALDVFELDGRARLTCRSIGSPTPLAAAAFAEEDCSSFETTPALAVGIGAFGNTFSECRARFGELISVAGATAYQPGDGTNVADYLVTAGGIGSDIRLLYCLACEGRFSHLIRFEALPRGATVGLSRLLSSCLEATGTSDLGVVMVAETSGLLGAAIRHAPTEPTGDAGFFSHPGVRKRLTFTAERAYRGSLALVAGVVTRTSASAAIAGDQLRPLDAGVAGHFHAAAFRFRPLRKAMLDLGETVSGLFEPDQLLGVMHLLNDDRGAAGAGESEFVTGACWIGPLDADGTA